MSAVRIKTEVAIPWEALIQATLDHASTVDPRELSEYDAKRLTAAARIILARLKETDRKEGHRPTG
jgi:hypothetical protein